MDKVDFTADAEPEQPFQNVRAGQKLQLSRQEDGSWCCNREDGSTLCPVPAAAAASLSQHHSAAATAVVRTVKRCQRDADAAVSIQVRISFSMPGAGPRLQQAPAPADDPSGFSLTTTELEQLACNAEIRSTLGDKRLQDLLSKIDGATNREEALQQAMDNPDFREFADKMLHVMKPALFPAP